MCSGDRIPSYQGRNFSHNHHISKTRSNLIVKSSIWFIEFCQWIVFEESHSVTSAATIMVAATISAIPSDLPPPFDKEPKRGKWAVKSDGIGLIGQGN